MPVNVRSRCVLYVLHSFIHPTDPFLFFHSFRPPIKGLTNKVRIRSKEPHSCSLVLRTQPRSDAAPGTPGHAARPLSACADLLDSPFAAWACNFYAWRWCVRVDGTASARVRSASVQVGSSAPQQRTQCGTSGRCAFASRVAADRPFEQQFGGHRRCGPATPRGRLAREAGGPEKGGQGPQEPRRSDCDQAHVEQHADLDL